MSRRLDALNGSIAEGEVQGELPDREFRAAWVLDGNVITLDDAAAQAILRTKVDAERDRRLIAGFEFNGKRFQSRPEDVTNILGAALEATIAIANGVAGGDLYWDGTGEPFGWIAEDNSPVPMDAPTTQEFGRAAAAHRKRVIRKARALKNMAPIPQNYTADAHWT